MHDLSVGVPVRVYRPRASTRPAPCVYYIHGGGMVAGSVDGDHGKTVALARATGVVDRHRELGIDPGRIGLYGSSAGGCLAVAVALLARDRGPAIAHQLLVSPMLDDRSATPARATDLSGLPPTYIDVGDLDLLRDEAVDFASRLSGAGVPVELHVYPGGIHGGESLAPDADLSIRVRTYRHDALHRALCR